MDQAGWHLTPKLVLPIIGFRPLNDPCPSTPLDRPKSNVSGTKPMVPDWLVARGGLANGENLTLGTDGRRSFPEVRLPSRELTPMTRWVIALVCSGRRDRASEADFEACDHSARV
jgi:hypothetical protein